MIKSILLISYLTLFGCICGLAGLASSASNVTNAHAVYMHVTSETPEGFRLILITTIWLSILAGGCICLAGKVRKLENKIQ